MSWLKNIPGIKDLMYGILTMPRRSTVQFTGAGVTCVDDGEKTVVAIPGASGALSESAVAVTPPSTANDYTFAGWPAATHVNLSGVATITGFAAPGLGEVQVKRLYVTSGAITIPEASTSSVAANRVTVQGDSGSTPLSAVLYPGDAAFLVYNTLSQRWHLILSAAMDVTATVPLLLGGNTDAFSSFASGRWTVGSFGAVGGTPPYLVGGATTPLYGNTRFIRLLQFGTTVTFEHEKGSVTSAQRINVTTGKNWTAVTGDSAFLFYSGSRWIIHPLVSGAGLDAGTTSATVLTCTADSDDVWTGVNNPGFTFSATGLRGRVRRSIFFPVGSLSVAPTFDTNLDPDQLLGYAFNTTSAAYLLTYEAFASGPCVAASFRKVTDL